MAQSKKQILDRWNEHCKLIRNSTGITYNESEQDKTKRIEHLKKDVKAMVEYYFPHYATSECADFHIEFANAVKRNKTFKGHAEWGRGLAKSVWCDIIIPFWLWMNDECNYVVLVGKTYDAACDLLGDLQAEFENNIRIKADFGEQKVIGRWEEGNFRTKSGFIGKALGMGQSVRGLRVGSQRPDLCITDDLDDRMLVKNPKRQREVAEWIEGALLGTMDGSLRRYMGANNKFAPNMIHDILRERHPKWFWHKVAAYDQATFKPRWKGKYDNNYYKDLEKELGAMVARAEYNNDPHIQGVIFTDDQIVWDKLPRMDQFNAIVAHWDIAYAGNSKSDFNAVRIWGFKDGIFWYISGFCKQSKMKAALEYMCDFKKHHKKRHIFFQYESQFWNDEVERTIQEVEKAQGVNLNLVKIDTPRSNKYDRILTLQPYFQNNRVRFNNKMKADTDTQVGNSQLKGIEPGYKSHDDAPDADQQAISKLSSMYQAEKQEVRLGLRSKKFRY